MEDRQSWRSILGIVLPLPEHPTAYDLCILTSWVAAVRARIEELVDPKHRRPEFLGIRERVYIASALYAEMVKGLRLEGFSPAILGRIDAMSIASNILTKRVIGLDALVGEGVDLLEGVAGYVIADRIEFNPEPLWRVQKSLGIFEDRGEHRYGSLLEYVVDPPEVDLIWRPRLP